MSTTLEPQVEYLKSMDLELNLWKESTLGLRWISVLNNDYLNGNMSKLIWFNMVLFLFKN